MTRLILKFLLSFMFLNILSDVGPKRFNLPPKTMEAEARKLVQGGRNVKPREIPFQVSLQTSWDQGKSEHKCGGSLLDEYTILTAAHCFDIEHPPNKVVAGVDNLNGPPEEEKWQWIHKFHVHPNYTHYVSKKNDVIAQPYDIAIVFVKKPFHFEKKEFAKLPEYGDYPKGNVQVSGWGDTYEFTARTNVRIIMVIVSVVGLVIVAYDIKAINLRRFRIRRLTTASRIYVGAAVVIVIFVGYLLYNPVKTLQVADLTVLPQKECERKINKYTKWEKGDWVKYMICTEPPHRAIGPLGGDSGGSLSQKGVVVGVVSTCFDYYSPLAVYMRVSAFRDWIDKTMSLPRNGTDKVNH